MTDTNNANKKKLYVLTRTRLEDPDPRHPYGKRETIKEYLQMRQDLLAIWVRKIGLATLYSESDAYKWYLFRTSEKEQMESYVNPCAEGHYLDIEPQHCFLDKASHDPERRLTNLDIQVAVSCKTCGMSVDIDLEHKLEDSVWDAIDMDRTASTRNAEPEQASQPYDEGRDGVVMDEGAAMLVLGLKGTRHDK